MARQWGIYVSSNSATGIEETKGRALKAHNGMHYEFTHMGEIPLL